jgi:hypothetical protein
LDNFTIVCDPTPQNEPLDFRQIRSLKKISFRPLLLSVTTFLMGGINFHQLNLNLDITWDVIALISPKVAHFVFFVLHNGDIIFDSNVPRL